MDSHRVNKSIQELMEEKANLALIELLEAQDRHDAPEKLAILQQNYAYFQNQFEIAQRNPISEKSMSTARIVSFTSSLPSVEKKSLSVAEPLYQFTNEESMLINNHYETLPKDLKALFDAALNDSLITLERIKNPVFLKGEGYIYDLSDVTTMLEKTGKANYPHMPQKQFTHADIIPCNTLIKAMLHMQSIIKGQKSSDLPVEVNDYMLEVEDAQASIPTAMIKTIEAYYINGIESKHRVLFDAVCRDSYTNMIMQKPVFLPDGFVYDRSTALMLLESAKQSDKSSAMCCKIDNIEFTVEDITPCPFSVAVIQQLKINIEEKQKAMQAAQNITNEKKEESDQSQRFGL